MAALSAKGSSISWKGQQSNVKNIFNDFAEQDPELNTDWDNLDEATLCARPVYERFAHFLLFVYVTPGSNPARPLDGDLPGLDADRTEYLGKCVVLKKCDHYVPMENSAWCAAFVDASIAKFRSPDYATIPYYRGRK